MPKHQIIKNIKDGKIGVLATDTLYGLVGSASNPKTVEKIYLLKKRDPSKPFIIIIGEVEELSKFKIQLDDQDFNTLKKYWPGPTSIVLPVRDEQFQYLHRGTNSLAFRVPAKKDLREILKLSGPIVAPSANPEGEKPATTVKMAKKYFGKNIDFYVDEGNLGGKPSTIIELQDGEVQTIRL